MNSKEDRTPSFVRNAWIQISRDKGLSIISIMVMGLTLLVTSVFSVVLLTANSVLVYLETRPQITIFFKNDFSEDKVKDLKLELQKRTDIASINFISKEDAFKFYLGQHQNEQSLLESVTSDIFPPALEVKAKKISDLGDIAKSLGKLDGVDEIVYFKDIIDTFKSWLTTVRIVGVVLVSVLALISLFIILITVGMTIRSRGEEIEIMKLLGATDNYVRLPFLTQGSFYGLVSGTLSALVLISLLLLLGNKIEFLLKGISTPPMLKLVLAVSLGQAILGMFIGAVGAWLSTKRYLRS